MISRHAPAEFATESIEIWFAAVPGMMIHPTLLASYVVNAGKNLSTRVSGVIVNWDAPTPAPAVVSTVDTIFVPSVSVARTVSVCVVNVVAI